MTKKIGAMILLLFLLLCFVTWFSGIQWSAAAAMSQPEQFGPGGQMVPHMLEAPQNIKLDRDIAFSTINGHELKLDIAYPKENRGMRPAIVYIHGGGFEVGDKSTDQAIFFARNGFIGIAIQYRLSGEAKFPAAVHDCKSAIRWIRANAKKFAIDPDKIGVIGASAGGYLAAMLGTSGGDAYLEGDGPYHEYSSRVQAVVDLFGPIELARMNDVKLDKHYNEKFLGKHFQEDLALEKRANPITYVDAKDPPTLMIHGDSDTVVKIRQSELLYTKLIKVGVKTKLVRVKNAGHGFAPSPEGAEINPSVKEIKIMEVQWFKDVFGMK